MLAVGIVIAVVVHRKRGEKTKGNTVVSGQSVEWQMACPLWEVMVIKSSKIVFSIFSLKR